MGKSGLLELWEGKVREHSCRGQGRWKGEGWHVPQPSASVTLKPCTHEATTRCCSGHQISIPGGVAPACIAPLVAMATGGLTHRGG